MASSNLFDSELNKAPQLPAIAVEKTGRRQHRESPTTSSSCRPIKVLPIPDHLHLTEPFPDQLSAGFVRDFHSPPFEFIQNGRSVGDGINDGEVNE